MQARGPEGASSPHVGEDLLSTPNCTGCLTRMDAVDSASGAPIWRCGACGQARLA